MQLVRDTLERYLILWLCSSAGLALYWGQNDPQAAEYFSFWKSWTMTPSIMLAMFCIGFLLPKEELVQVLKSWQAVLFGTCTQYLTMPLLAFLIANLFGFEGAIYAGVILVGTVPGAMASNVLTLTARGNVSYSICLTTLATLLSPIFVPLGLMLFLGVSRGPDPSAVFLNLLQNVAAPVIVGFFVKMAFARNRPALLVLAAILANLAILWIIAVAIGLNATRLEGVTALLLAALISLNALGYLAGWYSGGMINLDAMRRKALTLEIGMQNAGVGTILALQFFDDSTTAIPPAVYTFGCMLTGTLLASYWFWRGKQAL
ncbi:MAG: bile acid:sodium symporter family protein [Planctomycetaceae bacterium]|nr:bile acid:sodium symporter family protein [Planctomycetaceae bacterium]